MGNKPPKASPYYPEAGSSSAAARTGPSGTHSVQQFYSAGASAGGMGASGARPASAPAHIETRDPQRAPSHRNVSGGLTQSHPHAGSADSADAHSSARSGGARPTASSAFGEFDSMYGPSGLQTDHEAVYRARAGERSSCLCGGATSVEEFRRLDLSFLADLLYFCDEGHPRSVLQYRSVLSVSTYVDRILRRDPGVKHLLRALLVQQPADPTHFIIRQLLHDSCTHGLRSKQCFLKDHFSPRDEYEHELAAQQRNGHNGHNGHNGNSHPVLRKSSSPQLSSAGSFSTVSSSGSGVFSNGGSSGSSSTLSSAVSSPGFASAPSFGGSGAGSSAAPAIHRLDSGIADAYSFSSTAFPSPPPTPTILQLHVPVPTDAQTRMNSGSVAVTPDLVDARVAAGVPRMRMGVASEEGFANDFIDRSPAVLTTAPGGEWSSV